MRIMIVENKHHSASEMAREIRACGESVVGPFPSLAQAARHLSQADAAILDIWIGTEQCFEMADLLTVAGIPFIFVSGLEKVTLPQRHNHIELYAKPIGVPALLYALRTEFLTSLSHSLERSGAEPAKTLVRDLLASARQRISDTTAAERIVESVLHRALADIKTRRRDRMAFWLHDLLDQEIRNDYPRHLN
ncbi:response regulator [Pararhodobacter zhoushanensis]|uniref:response regulator n=1 Tax=Pararhodobacter zhoushanensis TaxID=2479545 RepID=UPI0013E0D0DB|nr:response regulator [Pararhodobacter zhoushanensis]